MSSCIQLKNPFSSIMKYSAAALIALVASVDTVAGFSASRSSLRQLSQPKNVAASSQQQKVGSSMKMEGALAVVTSDNDDGL